MPFAVVIFIIACVLIGLAEGFFSFWLAAKVVAGSRVTFLRVAKCQGYGFLAALAGVVCAALLSFIIAFLHLGIIGMVVFAAMALAVVVVAFRIPMRILRTTFLQTLGIFIVSGLLSAGVNKLASIVAGPVLRPIIGEQTAYLQQHAGALSPHLAKLGGGWAPPASAAVQAPNAAADLAADLDATRSDLNAAQRDAEQQFKDSTATYAGLSNRRKTLDTKDQMAVRQFNVLAADYETQKIRLVTARQRVTELLGQVNEQEVKVAEQAAAKSRSQVVMYSTSWCPACKAARAYLTEHNIPYQDYDVELSPEAAEAYQKLGGTAVPLIVINGESRTGFDPGWVTQRLQN